MSLALKAVQITLCILEDLNMTESENDAVSILQTGRCSSVEY